MSADESVQVEGIEDTLDFIDEFSKIDLRGRLREAARLVRDAARAHTQSRRVREALTYDVSVKSLIEYQARVGPERKLAWFAHFLEFGTRPHQIASGARARQVTASGRVKRRGHDIAGSRMHPGARAFPFLMPAEAETEEQVVDIVGQPFMYLGTGRVHA